MRNTETHVSFEQHFLSLNGGVTRVYADAFARPYHCLALSSPSHFYLRRREISGRLLTFSLIETCETDNCKKDIEKQLILNNFPNFRKIILCFKKKSFKVNTNLQAVGYNYF